MFNIFGITLLLVFTKKFCVDSFLLDDGVLTSALFSKPQKNLNIPTKSRRYFSILFLATTASDQF